MFVHAFFLQKRITPAQVYENQTTINEAMTTVNLARYVYTDQCVDDLV
jgi:hypothetical protein